MSQRTSIQRIAALIKGYKPGRNDSTFRSGFASTLAEAQQEGSLSQDDIEPLSRARTMLQAWTGDSPPKPEEAFNEWREFHETFGERLPPPLFDALLARVPKLPPKAFDWTSIVLTGDKRLIELLVARHVIKIADISRIAKSHALQFYRSSSLDVLLEHQAPAPRVVWGHLASGESRSEWTLGAAEALAESFALDRSSDAPDWMTRFLAKNADQRTAVLTQVLRDSGAMMKLARHLTTAALDLQGKRRKAEQSVIAPVIAALLQVCEKAIRDEKRTTQIASQTIGLLMYATVVSPTAFSDETLKAITASSNEFIGQSVVRALRSAETAIGDVESGSVMVVRGDQLYSAVQAYLRALPQGRDGDLESPERALRYERYMGRREVIQGLLSILDGPPDTSSCREAVDIALFNAGVRPLGMSEGRVTFDPETHAPDSSAILPGDSVVITQPGWRLGDEEIGIVLSKARVKPVERT